MTEPARTREAASGNKRDLEATRTRILSRAKSAFSKKGLEGARMDQIATAAKVSKAMIYYLYPSKEQLYKTVLEAIMRDIAAEARRVLSRQQFRPEDFRDLVRSVFDVLEKNVAVARIILRELANGAPYVKQIKREHPEHFQVFGLTIGRIYEYVKTGQMRDVPAERYVLAFLALVLIVVGAYPSTNLFLDNQDTASYAIDLDQWKDVVVDIFVRSML